MSHFQLEGMQHRDLKFKDLHNFYRPVRRGGAIAPTPQLGKLFQSQAVFHFKPSLHP